jgi:hypothetical protein
MPIRLTRRHPMGRAVDYGISLPSHFTSLMPFVLPGATPGRDWSAPNTATILLSIILFCGNQLYERIRVPGAREKPAVGKYNSGRSVYAEFSGQFHVVVYGC